MDRTHEININLLERVQRNQSRMIYWGLGILLAAVVAGGSGYWYVLHNRESNRLEAENTVLINQISSLEKKKDILTSAQGSKHETSGQRQAVETIESRKIAYSILLNEIDRVTPPGITMVGVETIGSRVILTGYCPDHGQVARLMEGLRNIPRVSNTTVFLAELNEKTNEVRYSIEINWEAELQ